MQTEYHPTLEVLESIFNRYGFSVTFSKQNNYVWLIEAVKGRSGA